MYYRNANCAVVVYDITQAVCNRLESKNQKINMLLVIARQGEIMGQRAAKTSQREYRDRSSW